MLQALSTPLIDRLSRNAKRSAHSPRLQPPASSLQPFRGISLLEVLIAMFVLLFGLMGVAAIFPVGNHYAGKSEQYDRGASMAGTAFAEVKARGMLSPKIWIYADGTTDYIDDVAGLNFGYFKLPLTPPTNPGPGHAFVIDPIGAADANAGDVLANYFPYDANSANANANPWNPGAVPLSGTKWPLRRVTFPNPNAVVGGKLPPRLASVYFRLHDDVVGELPEAHDHPGMQRWAVDNKGTKRIDDDVALAREYTGSYSWLATVVPTTGEAVLGLQPSNPRYGSYLYEVSVAVFYKRDVDSTAESKRFLQAELATGGDLVLYGPDVPTVDAALQDMKPSQWIALAGVHPTTGKFLLRWYRLLSLDNETTNSTDATPIKLTSTGAAVTGRRAMVEGPEWPTDLTPPAAQWSTNLRAILLPNAIGVATQTVKLDTE